MVRSEGQLRWNGLEIKLERWGGDDMDMRTESGDVAQRMLERELPVRRERGRELRIYSCSDGEHRDLV